MPFWNKQLNRGCRLTGIGGSDNHRPLQPLDQTGSIGSPTTVVYATDLSTPAILDGIRAGHVFIDVAGTKDRLLDLSAHAGNQVRHSGDSLDAGAGMVVHFEAHATNAVGGHVRWVEDGREIPSPSDAEIHNADQTVSLSRTSDGQRHWLRAEVVSAEGTLWLIANPVYTNWAMSNECNQTPR